jgi:hypothetical protein
MTKRFTCLLTVLSFGLMLTGCSDSKPSEPSIKSGNVDPNARPAKIGAPGGGGGAASKPKGVD